MHPIHALDICIDAILRLLPAKHRLFLLATCKPLSAHTKAAIADMVPEVRYLRAGERAWCMWCEIALGRDFVSFAYRYDSGRSDGVHSFRAIYKTPPRYVRAIWDAMPVPEKQTVKQVSIEGNKTFATVAVTGRLWIGWRGRPERIQRDVRVGLDENDEGLQWEAAFSSSSEIRGRDRAGWHLWVLEQIMAILHVRLGAFELEDEYGVQLPAEPEEGLYDPVSSGDEVEEVYSTDHGSMRFRRPRWQLFSDGCEF